MQFRFSISLIFLMVACEISHAQLDPLLSLYPYTALFYNPGYTGYHEKSAVALSGRAQWIGLEGAPTTVMVAYDLYLKKKHLGFGIVQLYDEIGFTTTNKLGLNYAYKFDFDDSISIRLGVQASVVNLTTDYSKFVFFTPNPNFPTTKESDTQMDFDYGIWFNAKNFYFGLSSRHLAEPEFQHDNVTTRLRRHYYLTTGYLFEVSELIGVKPSLRWMGTASSSLLEVNVTLIISDLMHIGISSRGLGNNINPYIISLGTTIKKKFEAMVAYDVTNNTGFGPTAEAVLRYQFGT